MDVEEKKWRAENDLRVLRDYDDLINDEDRMSMAEAELMKQSDSLSRIRKKLPRNKRSVNGKNVKGTKEGP